MLEILVLKKFRQEDYHEFKAILNYKVSTRSGRTIHQDSWSDTHAKTTRDR